MERKSKNVEDNTGRKSGACGVNPSRMEFMLGDIIWVKIRGSSWWPAQVVDENSRVGGKKMKKKMEGAILTRLYGSYDYMYVDPMKYQSEFENVLKQNNLRVKEILQKALDQENHASKKRKKRVPSAENGEHEKRVLSAENGGHGKRVPSAENGGCNVREKSKQNRVEKNRKVDGLLDSSKGASTRRTRVMQSLGLIAPCGSPFLRRDVSSSLKESDVS